MSLRIASRLAGVQRTLIRQIFDSAPADAINLGLGQPDLPTPPSISRAGIRGIAEGRTGYTSTAGNTELRAAVARLYGAFAPGHENVAITVGTQEAVFASVMTLADPGDEVLYPDPGYPAYSTVARLVGATGVPYPLSEESGFRIRADMIARLISDRTRLVILCAPSNPTGAVHDASELRRLVEILEDRGIPWVSDEIYGGFVYRDRSPSPSEFSRTGGLVISGLSKVLSMTGWRIGWVVGPAETITRIIAVHQHLVTCAPSISQYAAMEALGESGGRAAAEYLEIFRGRRDLMARELSLIDGIEFREPDGAFYFFVKVEGCNDSLLLCRRIMDEARVVTIPGIAFGMHGEGFIRLSFAAGDEDIRNGVRAISGILRR